MYINITPPGLMKIFLISSKSDTDLIQHFQKVQSIQRKSEKHFDHGNLDSTISNSNIKNEFSHYSRPIKINHLFIIMAT